MATLRMTSAASAAASSAVANRVACRMSFVVPQYGCSRTYNLGDVVNWMTYIGAPGCVVRLAGDGLFWYRSGMGTTRAAAGKKTGRPQKHKWDDSYYAKTFALAQSGLVRKHIAKALGVPWGVFQHWLETKPALRDAVKSARTPVKSESRSSHLQKAESGVTFIDYVYGRLPPELQDLWDTIHAINRGKVTRRKDGSKKRTPYRDAAEQIDRVFDRAGIKYARQSLWIHAYIRCNFNGNEACRIVNISRTAYDKWREDPRFRQMMDIEMPKIKADYAESQLWQGVNEGSDACRIFMGKAMNPAVFNPPKQVNHGGSVDLKLKEKINVEDEIDKLPLENRRQLLEAIRNAREMREAKPPALEG